MASASEAEVLIVVDNLKEFVEKNGNLITKQHTKEVRNLCVALERLQDLIKLRRGNLEKLVISSIRELVHEAEEAIETCVVQELKRKTVRAQLKRSIGGFKEEDQELDKRLQDVREKVDQVVKNFDRLEHLKFTKKKDQRWNDKALFPGDDKHTVGCEDEVQTVIDLLKTDSGANLEVISITGMVGLGKTTLARRVFKDQTVESLFSLRAFVSVPQEYNNNNKNKVFLEILKQFGEEEIYGKEETELVEMLRDFLNNSSFLIVLDDVCSQEVLEDIRSLVAAQPQQQGNQGNHQHQRRVLLITARGRKLAVGMGCKNHHDLRLLDLKESQELLRMETFGKNECPMALEECETKILGKCYGLPLAIVSFARILAKRREKIEWWKKAADYVNVFTEESQINKAIRAIFDGLNDNLKLCFLYLGVFKRDLHIPVWVLLRLWMAEGLVREEGSSNTCLEDVAKDYLEELVEKKLVIVTERRSNGKIKAIKMHSGLLDFCISEAKEENLFNESFSFETCRRFCIPNSVVSQFHKLVPSKATTATTNPLRSILYFSDDQMIRSSSNIPKPPVTVRLNNVIKPFKTRASSFPADELFSIFLSSIPKTFKLLRVLDIRSFLLTELPAKLFSLFLLRYIAISCNSSFLPKELCNLYNLQTLIIQTSSESETLEIRADVRDMVLLRHIHSNKSTLLRKVKEKTTSVNQNLQTISIISPKSCTKELFDKTPNLKKLGISGKLPTFVEGNHNKHNFFEHLAGLNHLQNLKLLHNDGSSKYALPLKSRSFPGNLTNLTLMNTYLDEESMSRIEAMENLEILKLKGTEFKEALWECKDGGFSKLKVLHIKLTNLEQWKASGNHFPNLTSLFLWHCHKLQTLPVGLPVMRSLETVDLYYGHNNLSSSLETILRQKLRSQPGFKLFIFPHRR